MLGAFYVLVDVGVERFLKWPIGELVARVLFGLLGLAMVGLGSKAVFAVLTGRPTAVPSKPHVFLAGLLFVLMGLLFIFLAVVADTKGF